MTGWRIVCDAGGTNLRCARSQTPAHMSDLLVMPSGEAREIDDVLKDYAARFADAGDFQGAAIAAAGPIENARVRLTNRDMVIDSARVSRAIGGKPVALLNDLEAAAWSLPALKQSELSPVLERADPLDGPRLVINVGTGFGGALLVRTTGGWHAVACEPGHMKLACPATSSQDQSNPVSVEDMISGITLSDPSRREKLWEFAGPLRGGDAAGQFPALQLGGRPDPFIVAFSRLLGQVCGDLVLACGAWGGVYLCGSVASAWQRAGGTEAFQAAFEDKGPMAPRMRRVRVQMITAENPVLTGLCQVPL